MMKLKSTLSWQGNHQQFIHEHAARVDLNSMRYMLGGHARQCTPTIDMSGGSVQKFRYKQTAERIDVTQFQPL